MEVNLSIHALFIFIDNFLIRLEHYIITIITNILAWNIIYLQYHQNSPWLKYGFHKTKIHLDGSIFRFQFSKDVIIGIIDNTYIYHILSIKIKEICIYNTERTLRLYLSAVTDIDIITPLSYPLKWYWSRDYADVTIHNTEQDFLMFKYMINIIGYGSFRITSRINSRPISSLELKLSGWYWCLGLIRDVIRKELYNILSLSIYIYI